MSACNASATDIAWYSGYSWLHRPKLPGGMEMESRNCKPSVGSGNDCNCDLAYDTNGNDVTDVAATASGPQLLRPMALFSSCGSLTCELRNKAQQAIYNVVLNKAQQAIYKVVRLIAVCDPDAGLRIASPEKQLAERHI